MQQDRNKAWGFSLFCDDIRMEIGGKMTVVGIYQTEMILNGTFPFIVPKFQIIVMYFEVFGSISSDVTFRVTSPGPEAADMTISENKIERRKIPSPPNIPNLDESDERIWSARVPFLFAPLLLPREGRIRVRAHYDDGTELRLGSLGVRTAKSEEIPLFAAAGAPSPPPANG
jgi:hypothetical protein